MSGLAAHFAGPLCGLCWCCCCLWAGGAWLRWCEGMGARERAWQGCGRRGMWLSASVGMGMGLGVNPCQRSWACMRTQLTGDGWPQARVRRVVSVRNEMLRRQRSKIEEGGACSRVRMRRECFPACSTQSLALMPPPQPPPPLPLPTPTHLTAGMHGPWWISKDEATAGLEGGVERLHSGAAAEGEVVGGRARGGKGSASDSGSSGDAAAVFEVLSCPFIAPCTLLLFPIRPSPLYPPLPLPLSHRRLSSCPPNARVQTQRGGEERRQAAGHPNSA